MPAMWIGTTAAPERSAIHAAPGLWGWPQPSGLRPPSGNSTRLHPSRSRASAWPTLRRLTPSRSIGMALSPRAEAAEVTRVGEEVVGGGADEHLVAPRLRQRRDDQRRVEVAVVVGGEDQRRIGVGVLPLRWRSASRSSPRRSGLASDPDRRLQHVVEQRARARTRAGYLRAQSVS